MIEQSAIKVHQPCPHCGSSDAAAEYTDHWHCFSCGKTWRESCQNTTMETRNVKENVVEIVEKGKIREIPDRGLTKETCEKYGVRTLQQGGKIVKHFYPYYDRGGSKVAEKTRVVGTKEFFWSGDSTRVSLFGSQAFPNTGKYITVTEGEMDCLALYQMFGGKYPVVSIPSGAKGYKAIKDNYEYLDSFDNIVLCWDGDEVGREAVKVVAQMLPPKKVKIVKMPQDAKDANEMLLAGRSQEMINLWWRAEEYRPDDIINIGDMFDRLAAYRKSHTYTPSPWAGLNDHIQGTRPGQLIVMAAGTGQGKSAFLKSWMYYLVNTTDFTMGALYLEENPEETVISLMSLAAGMNLKKNHVWDACTPEELKKHFDACGANRRIELFEPLSNTEPEYVCNKIRYLAVARGCKVIFLDHLTYLVDDSDDPRRTLNKLVKNLHDLCVELGIVVIAACHLRKAQNAAKSHEEGGRVVLDDLKDSSSIKQLSDVVIGLERDSQAEDPMEANTTTLRVLKNRDFGTKGPAAKLYYDGETTRLVEVGFENDVADFKEL